MLFYTNSSLTLWAREKNVTYVTYEPVLGNEVYIVSVETSLVFGAPLLHHKYTIQP